MSTDPMTKIPDFTASTRRLQAALDYAKQSAGTEGAHHLKHVIDQMVRLMTGCPEETASAIDGNGKPYNYQRLGENEEYRQFVAAACAGPESVNDYEWDVGIP